MLLTKVAICLVMLLMVGHQFQDQIFDFTWTILLQSFPSGESHDLSESYPSDEIQNSTCTAQIHER